MSLIINLPPDKEAALKARAQAAGLQAERYAQQVLERDLAVPQFESVAHLQRTNPEEWGRHLDAWLDSQEPNRPVFSDEAMSRASIYPDRV